MHGATALDLTQVVDALASGELSSASLVDQSLAAIARQNPCVRAYTCVDDEGARAAASEADARRARDARLSVLDGVPVGVKANIAIRGFPHTAGLQVYRARVATEDAFVIQRLRTLGAIPIGITNMDEAALGAATMNAWYGVTQNPRRGAHSTGGSSGGSAAALAADTVPLALGTDTIGSVRIPASYCGVSALKPSYGLISVRGVEPVHLRFDHVGPMTRTARDLAIAAPLLAVRDRSCGVSRRITLREPTPKPSLRIGYATGLAALGITDGVQDAYDAGLERLRSLGYLLVPVDVLPWDLVRVRRAVFSLCEMELWRHHRNTLANQPDLFSRELYEMLAYGGRLTGKDVDRFEQRLADFNATIASLLTSLDVLVTPTTPHTAFAHDEPHPQNGADLTCIASSTGLPAVAVPLAGEELPASMQFVGTMGGDLEIIALAARM